MAIGDIDEAEVEEGTDVWNVMRIVNQAGTAIVRADITNWDLVVWELESGSTVYSLTGVSNADTATFLVFDALQTGDGFWGEDSDGYNIRHYGRVAELGTSLKGGKKYRWEYGFNTSSYGRLTKRFTWDVKASKLV